MIFLVAGCGGDDDVAAVDAPPVVVDAPSIDAPPGVVPRNEPGPCRFTVPAQLGLVEGQGYACGDVVVYEDRAARGRTIRVHYIKFESAAASANATIYLDGGPGGDGQNIIQWAGFLGAPFLDGLRVDGDFVVLGQRGTSRSIPFLECEDSCPDVDLRAYNTAANADDVEDLRVTLGYEQLNLYGISYGSRLGLEVLRRHGEHVRAAVIEGLVPAQTVWPAAVPASFHGALTALNASCAADGACGAAFGDLRAKFSAGAASLNANPLPMTIAGSPIELWGSEYTYLLFRFLYSRSTYPWLPLLINDVAARRVDRIQGLLEAAFGGGGSSISMGLYNSVVCGEIFNPPDPDAFAEANAGVPADIVELMSGSWYGLVDRCASWPLPSAGHQTALAQPVTSSVRTLVSSGRLDPITPPSFGAIAAAGLTNAEVVVHESSGHGATLQSPCGQQNLYAFLANPGATHDLSCAETITTSYTVPQAFAFAPRPIPVERIRAELALMPVLPEAERRLQAKLRR